jgi:hypothetical protein
MFEVGEEDWVLGAAFGGWDGTGGETDEEACVGEPVVPD